MGFKFGLKREGDKTRLNRNEPSGGMPDFWAKSIAQLKCTEANAHGMDNKQEELETTVQKESCDIVSLTEIWWTGGRVAEIQPSRKEPGVAC